MANITSVGLGKQSAFGAAASTLTAINVTSVDRNLDIERIENDEMFGELDTFAPEQGIKQANVSLAGRAYPSMMGHILQMAAGAPSTTGSDPYEHEFTPSDTLPPRYTVGISETNGISAKVIDALVSSFTLTQDMGGVLQWSLDAIASDRVAGAVTLDGTPETGRAFRFDDLTVTVDSGAVVNFKTLNLTVSNPVSNIFTLNGTNTAAAQEYTGHRTVELSGTLRFTNDAASYRAEFEANTALDLELAWEIDAEASLTIHIPNFRLNTDPNPTRGFAETEVDFAGTGYFDSTAGYSVKFTLVNDTASY